MSSNSKFRIEARVPCDEIGKGPGQAHKLICIEIFAHNHAVAKVRARSKFPSDAVILSTELLPSA